MSAQFINSNNQSLLWKVINNTPQMINYFSNANPGEKEKWFQSVIGHIYNQYNGQNISLRDMNKRSIDFMLQAMVPQAQVPQIQPTYQGSQMQMQGSQTQMQGSQMQGSQMQMQAPYQVVKNKENQLNDQFNRRQAEYDSMIKKEVPTPHFNDNIKDEAIVDLGSAVEEYMKQRNQDIQTFKPAKNSIRTADLHSSWLVTDNDSNPSTESADLNLHRFIPKKLDLKDAEPIHLTVEELPKKVQWGENTEHVFDKNESIVENTRLSNIEQKISNLEKDVDEIKSKMSEMITLLKTSIVNVKNN